MTHLDDIRGKALAAVSGAGSWAALAAALKQVQDDVNLATTKEWAASGVTRLHDGLSLHATEGWLGTVGLTAKFAIRDVTRDSDTPITVAVVTENEGEDAATYRYLWREGLVDRRGANIDDHLEFIDGVTVDWSDIVAVHF